MAFALRPQKKATFQTFLLQRLTLARPGRRVLGSRPVSGKGFEAGESLRFSLAAATPLLRKSSFFLLCDAPAPFSRRTCSSARRRQRGDCRANPRFGGKHGFRKKKRFFRQVAPKRKKKVSAPRRCCTFLAPATATVGGCTGAAPRAEGVGGRPRTDSTFLTASPAAFRAAIAR
jgi:hypothetical protein